MELKGIIKKILETQTFASGFQIREMVLLTEEQYPQPISIEFLSEKAEILNNYKEGDKVTIGINLRGREWTNPQGETKYFNSITGWKINKISNSDFEPKTETTSNHQANVSPFDEDEDEDDLPF